MKVLVVEVIVVVVTDASDAAAVTAAALEVAVGAVKVLPVIFPAE